MGQPVDGLSAHDGSWCAAKVIALNGEGDDATATLKFIGYAARWNEEKKDSDFAICARLSSEERILAKHAGAVEGEAVPPQPGRHVAGRADPRQAQGAGGRRSQGGGYI